jgi:hypothetical protein
MVLTTNETDQGNPLRHAIHTVLAAARDYSPTETPAMQRRDTALADMVTRLDQVLPELSQGLGLASLELRARRGGHQASYSPTAWVRIYAHGYSPTAMEGFYIVYLFASDGSAVYLSLNQGTSEYRSNAMRPINDRAELRARAAEARRSLSDFQETPLMKSATVEIDLTWASTPGVGPESRRRTRNYEDANILAVRYPAAAVPPDEAMLQDLSDMLPLLAALYQRLPTPLPAELTPGHSNSAVGRQRLVLIAPCYGNAASRARFADTLEREVAFTDPPLRDRLSASELGMLLKLHPGGAARFWGALARHDSKIDRLASGDPILFTGLNRVQATGKVGCKLRNQALADALWTPDPDTGSWSNVYSVLDFRRVDDIKYSDIQGLAGYSPRDRFQETRVTSADQAEALISGLGLDGEIDDQEEEQQRDAEALLRALATDSAVVDAEASHVGSTEYERKAGKVTVWRGEAQLVARYRETLPETQAKRLRLAVGYTDLYREEDGDLIEAKVSARHRYVREALGQLLDYAAHCPLPVNRLTALFPQVPASSDIRLLHAFGIDCLYWTGGDNFPRREAPAEVRERMAEAWSSLARR